MQVRNNVFLFIRIFPKKSLFCRKSEMYLKASAVFSFFIYMQFSHRNVDFAFVF